MITREFNLYLHAGHSIPLVINVNQYDQGEQWLFTLFNADGTQYTPSSGAIVGIKSDNLGIINSGTVDSQGRVVINETQQMTAAVGKAVFELVIDDGTHGTANFVVLVEPKPGDNADLSESDLSLIEQAIEAASSIKPYGSPLVASTVADMTDHEKVYVYVGSETGYTSGHWYYYDGDSWEDGGVYNSVAVQTDTTLTLSGVAADAKKVGDEINDLKSQIAQLSAIPTEVKHAMDALFSTMAIIGDTDDSYASEVATIHAWATAVNLVSISAVFNQGANVIYDVDDLDSLRDYLTVTATYDDGTTPTVTTYTLSGSLEEGTSTITVTFDGMTDTFDVVVSPKIVYDLDADDLSYCTLQFSSPYYANNQTRLSYYQFDLLIQQGKKYEIKAYSDDQTADMSVHVLNTTAVTKASNGQTFSGDDADYSWRGTLDFTYDANTTINGKAPKAIRLSFKYADGSTISTKFITRVTIREVK